MLSMLGMLRTGASAPLVSLSLLLAGCSGAASPERVIAGFGDGVHDIFAGHQHADDETIVFEGRAVIAVDVEDFGGDVHVIADPRAKAATVTIEREGTHGFMRMDESKASLQHIAASVQLVPGDLGPTLRIRATTSDPEPFFQRAHVRIVAPFIENVRVRTDRAFVEMEGVEGAIDVESGGGDVRLMTTRPLVEDVVIVNRQGAIDYRVTGRSTGAFDIETIGGAVRVRVKEGSWVVSESTSQSQVKAVLNDGANRVLLRTVDADVRVAIVAEPTQVGKVIVDP
ncbi:MAG: hypothetical protein U0575_02470 [Phycisphaerales bacterium]